MSSATLHYLYDPLCGWCYAAAPLVEAASQFVPIQLHGGGMMTGKRRQKITPAWRDYVRPQDRQIGQATASTSAKPTWMVCLKINRLFSIQLRPQQPSLRHKRYVERG